MSSLGTRPRTWIETSSEALSRNLQWIASQLPGQTLLAPVVKSNAYGHGLEVVVSALKNQVSWFCVDSASEANRVTAIAPEAKVLLMGMLCEEEIPNLSDRVRPVVFSVAGLKALGRHSQPRSFHLELETGLNRLGLSGADLPSFLEELKQFPHLTLEGAYTHFANVEDTLDPEFYQIQYQTYCELLQRLPMPVLRHTSASAAALLYPKDSENLVRLGISLYGYPSSWQTLLSLRERGTPVKLSPALSWKCRIAQIKEVKAMQTIGYGCTYRCVRDSRIAVLPVGYADGYDRAAGRQGHVIVAGQLAPVVGRVAMNMMMIDVTHIEAVESDSLVTILGSEGTTTISAEDLAKRSDTISYEILSRLNPAIPRIAL